MSEAIKQASLQKLFLADPDAYKRVILSAPQRKMLRLVNRFPQGIGSAPVACRLSISVQSASVRLKVLFEKGYLKREEIAAESGGIEFIYKVKK